jgi:RES domain-containing protein
MKIYRIARTEFCNETGEGAKRWGGRWNLPGHPAIYGCGSVAAALLERLTVDSELFSSERYTLYSVMEFNGPEHLIHIIDPKDLPKGWDTIPATKVSQEFGTKLLQSGTVCFGVPSVVDTSSFNFVFNPLAKDFRKFSWRVYPLTLDQRIVR